MEKSEIIPILRQQKHVFLMILLSYKTMKTLSISISEAEYQAFGINGDSLNFSELLDLVSRELTRQNLDKCVELAEKHGLSAMTMDEITNEVKAVRLNAKRHH